MTVAAPVTRQSGLGGTDISAVLGMNPWRSAWDVYAEKTGLVDQVIEETERMKWGKRLQRVIADAYTEETGTPHVWCDETKRHPSRGFQVWTPDALCLKKGLDCKTAGLDQWQKWGESGSKDIPDYVAIQSHWYLSAEEDCEAWDIALLIAGSDFRIYSVERDQEVEGILLETGERFWRDHILAGKEPEFKDTETARNYLAHRFPKNTEALRFPTEDEMALIERYRSARNGRKSAVKVEDDLEIKLKLAVGDDAGFQWGGEKWTYKRSKDGAVTDWRSLALPLLEKLQDDDRRTLLGLHTKPKPGSRRIYVGFKEEK